MTSRQFPDGGEPQGGNRLSRMVALSAVIHVVLIATIMLSAVRGNPTVSTPPTAYTVSLIDPAALGTNLPGGGSKPSESVGAPKPAADVKPAPVAKKEEPKAPPPPPKEAKDTVKLPDKEKPLEKPPVKPEPEKAKVEEKKPEPKKPEAKPEPQPSTTKDTKKPEPKPEPQPKPEEQKAEPPKAKPAEQSSEERDQQILAALNRIKTKVDKDAGGSGTASTTASATEGPGAGIKGSGPATLGGAPGAGGGGTVRRLEYIMYTEQVKRRVKENWIVAERRDRLNAIVRFNVQPDGEIAALEMLKSSGDPTFDQSVLRAVNKANPLPPPPEAYREEFVSQKVEVTFRSEEQTN